LFSIFAVFYRKNRHMAVVVSGQDALMVDSWVFLPVVATDLPILQAQVREFGWDDWVIPEEFLATAGEILLDNYSLSSNEKCRLVLIGLGSEFSKNALVQYVRSAIFKFQKHFKEAQRFVLFSPTENEVITAGLVQGAILSGYEFGFLKKVAPTNPTFQVETWELVTSLLSVADVVRDSRALAEVQLDIMKLVNTPSNIKTPNFLANWASEKAQFHGLPCQILKVPELKKKGFDALLAVGQGSANPPVMIQLTYDPGIEGAPHVVLVGKGITFDTGGISLKDSPNMHWMKSDMGGAAAVLGGILFCVRLGLPMKVTTLVMSAENSIDAKSIRPGDVINSYLGKTIEVIDTDAEGRLVLADGLGYAVKELSPDVILDFATLTGSSVQTLGYHAASLFTKNDLLARQLQESGDKIGERLWRFPLWDIYNEDIKSDIADLRNYSNKPVAGAISAAKFLEAFTEKHPCWAHVDMAGVALAASEFTWDRTSTAYGVGLIGEYLSQLVRS
jgi:leucyl aminopeptidase